MVRKRGRAYDMRAWLEEHGTLTDAQKEAIENMLAGVARWLERG